MDTALRLQEAPTTGRTDRLPAALRVVAIAACVPYLTLKLAWLSGSHIGIPAGSELRRNEGVLFAANAATVAMDAAVIVLAFALTRAWGRRLPGWLLLLPLWVATGLLAPVVVGFPLQLVAGLLGVGSGAADPADDEPFLAEWVFGVVYTGFGVQALALGWLFVRYGRERWGAVLRGRVGGLRSAGATAAVRRTFAVVTAVLAVAVAGANGLWAAGGDAGLSARVLAEQTGGQRLIHATAAAFALAATAGVLLAAFPGLRPRVRMRTVVALGWTGGAALAAWAGWLLAVSLGGDALPGGGNQPSQAMNLVYAGEMITGTLTLLLGAQLLAELREG
ncbi:hypothetical protein [Streptomyces boninensis]|uniref:hypothetical protein n=1 Tax=Streptomyces boninensis TaxID=2039455 RepID=UPI003B20E839